MSISSKDNVENLSNLLSPREKECLTWAAKGKTNKEIAIILSLSANSVNSYINSASKKLNTTSKMGAIVLAVSHGLIFPL